MSMYAQEVVSFDLVPPLRYMGADAFRKRWEETFSSFQGPIGYEIHDLNITVGDDVAFTHYLAPFLLTQLLLDVLKASAPSRIVNVSTVGHKIGKIDFTDLQGDSK